MAIRYRNPVPKGTVGRTDQGVDISAPPGTPVYAIANEKLVGILQNWYQGQPFYWFKEQGSNAYNYVAEQFQSGMKIGQSVKAGQQIGQVARSGTGLELGYATASGQTVSTATTGAYSGSGATAAGSAYRSQVIQGGSAPAQSTLAQLWVNNGGPANVANLMAAIAMAESGGNTTATNKDSNGTTDYGIWQINSSHGYNSQRLLANPNYNAKAAVAIYKSQGLTAWSTYVSGAYLQFTGGSSKYTPNYGGPNGGIVRPGGGSDTTSSGGTPLNEQYAQLLSRGSTNTDPIGNDLLAPFKFWWGQESSAWNNFFNSITGPVDGVIDAADATVTVAQDTAKVLELLPWYALRFAEFTVGITMMSIGLYMSAKPGTGAPSSPGRAVRTIVGMTPVGREMRIAGATRAGRREGQTEHYRLQARREARANEAGKTINKSEARKTQSQGQSRRGNN
jgi:hypothetical protein